MEMDLKALGKISVSQMKSYMRDQFHFMSCWILSLPSWPILCLLSSRHRFGKMSPLWGRFKLLLLGAHVSFRPGFHLLFPDTRPTSRWNTAAQFNLHHSRRCPGFKGRRTFRRWAISCWCNQKCRCVSQNKAHPGTWKLSQWKMFSMFCSHSVNNAVFSSGKQCSNIKLCPGTEELIMWKNIQRSTNWFKEKGAINTF